MLIIKGWIGKQILNVQIGAREPDKGGGARNQVLSSGLLRGQNCHHTQCVLQILVSSLLSLSHSTLYTPPPLSLPKFP